MIAMLLSTSYLFSKENVRALQRKLYLKAKQDSSYRFYALYDKVTRSDVLHRAYDLVRQNKGSAGLDRETFESIELGKGKLAYLKEVQESLKTKTYRAMPVKRVEIPKANGETRPLGIPCIKDRIVQMAVKLIIEPIFEADFSPHSYGFRPKRSAHMAMNDIADAQLQGYTQVIDADLSKYFDTIPHGKLLRTVAKRIADGTILALLKQWLSAKVIKVEAGKEIIIGGKKTRKGTPQGGVISPLLANIYLDILDQIWEKYELAKKYHARLVRYADDMVILCQKDTAQPFAIVETILEKLELTLNKEKTHIVNSRKESFGFLGFEVEMIRNKESGKSFPRIEPSAKSMKSIKGKIKAITARRRTCMPLGRIVKELNRVVRGWGNYFHYGYSHRKIKKVRFYLEESLRSHLRYRHKLKNRGAVYKRFSWHYLYKHLNLYKMPTTLAWKTVQV